MKICFEILANGKAGNGRFVKNDYIPQGEEQLTDGDDLSVLDQFNTEAYTKQANKDAAQALAYSKIDEIMPEASTRNKMKALSRAAKLIRKEAKGNASAEDIAELDAFEALEDGTDAIQDAADAIKDQIDIDVDYDYINSPLWP